MKIRLNTHNFCIWGLCSILLLGMLGCSTSPKIRTQQGSMDTAQHHVLRGNDKIEQENWTAALEQFDLALSLDPEFSSALAGKALVQAYQTSQDGRTQERQDQLRSDAQDGLSKAFDTAQTPKEQAYANVAGIRILNFLKSDGWLSDAEGYFSDAVSLFEDNVDLRDGRASAYFYMANAYRDSLEFGKASDHYRKVLEFNRDFTAKASTSLELLDKIIRAQPGSRHGKIIALVPRIGRADLSALLIEELHLARLYERNNSASGKPDLSYRSPNKNFVPIGERKRDVPVASDIMEHPLKIDIEEVLNLGVRGLEANPQHLFFPNRELTRAEYALVLEDVLIQVTQDKRLGTRFVGQPSPWPDTRADAYYYNAARTLVSRSIMSVSNKTRGLFGPNLPVHGADALLSIRLLKNELQSYVRSGN